MKFTTALAAIATALSSIAVASADDMNTRVPYYMTGEELTTDCRAYLTLAKASMRTSDAQLTYQAGICLGAVTMFFDAAAVERMRAITAKRDFEKSYCVPDDMNVTDLAEVVANYLDQHPEKRTFVGWILIQGAFIEKFPCAGLNYDALPN